jgi:hypothetical protein
MLGKIENGVLPILNRTSLPAAEIGKRDVFWRKRPIRWNFVRNVAQEILLPQANLHVTKAAEPVGAAAGKNGHHRSIGSFSDR